MDEFVSREDGFSVNVPGQPRVQETTFVSEYNYMLPARVYSAERGRERYSMTVVDYNGIEKMGEERAKGCPPSAEPCHGSRNTGAGYWKMDIGGAIVYATWKYLQRDVTLTYVDGDPVLSGSWEFSKGPVRNKCAILGVEAPVWQGARRKNTWCIRPTSNAVRQDGSAARMAQLFRTGP